MRHRNNAASVQTASRRASRSSEVLVLGCLLIAGVWIAYSFAQEVILSHHLSQQAYSMRMQNQTLQAENSGYQRDIAGVASGAAAEEESRINGYVRSDERIYLVSAPPANTPAPVRQAKAQAKVKVVSDHPSPIEEARRWLSTHLRL